MPKFLFICLLAISLQVSALAQVRDISVSRENIDSLSKKWKKGIFKDIFRPNQRKYPKSENAKTGNQASGNDKTPKANKEQNLSNTQYANEFDWYNLAWDITEYAKDFLHTHYRYGGESPRSGFDCSGFTQYVFKEYNIYLDRTARQQSRNGKKIKIRQADIGDLIVFGSNKNNITHVAIVYDKHPDLKIIHSSSSKGVIVTNLETDSYWRNKMLFAVRLF